MIKFKVEIKRMAFTRGKEEIGIFEGQIGLIVIHLMAMLGVLVVWMIIFYVGFDLI
jgi:hypothetical protein